MNTGGEVAGIVANIYMELGKRSIELSTKILSTIMLSLLKSVDKKLNTGEISMKRMLSSGEDIKQVKINEKDATDFITKAKNYGITFSLLDKVPNDGKYTLVFKEKEQEIVNIILKDIIKDKQNNIDIQEDKSLVDEFLVGGNKDFFIVDRENPNNYIQSNIEQLDLQKGLLVNKNNPEEYIEFNENIKEKQLSIVIHKDGKVESYDTTKSSYDEVKEKISIETNKWQDVLLCKDEEERTKYKEKDKDIDKNKDKDGDKKTLEQVESEVKEKRNTQPIGQDQSKKKAKSKVEKEK